MCVCNGTAEPHARSQHNTVNHCARSVARLCPTLGSPMGWSPPRLLCPLDSPARLLEWVALLPSRRSSPSRDWPGVSCIAGY